MQVLMHEENARSLRKSYIAYRNSRNWCLQCLKPKENGQKTGVCSTGLHIAGRV